MRDEQIVPSAAREADRPLRIAIITETFLPKIDGIVTRLCHTLRHLREMGHEVLVVAPRGVEEFEGTPVHGVSGFPFPLYPELKLAIPRPSVGRVLKKFRPEIIHAVNPAVLGVTAFFSSSYDRVPLIVSYHTHLPKYLRYYRLGLLEGPLWWCMRSTYNRADLTLATSQAMQGELEARGIHRVHLWRRGVDTDLFHPKKATREMRARLTAGHPEEKLLVYIGRLSAEKEIERCREVLEALPGVRLALVGDGPQRKKLEEYFAGTPTQFAGFMQGDELAAAFASADAFFLPSRTETLGLVLLEAMAAGCPVVTPLAGGTSDVVQDGVTGFLYDPTSPTGAVDAVRKLLFDAEIRAEMGERARADAERWGWGAATFQLEQYYRRVLAREAHLPKQIAERRTKGVPADAICQELRISKATFRRHAGGLAYRPAED
ncbi:MAG TPA: glycosyltransferase [Terracidiphilus sp.]|nr:glycosyltransferase [Terracidiphilus sp.]